MGIFGSFLGRLSVTFVLALLWSAPPVTAQAAPPGQGSLSHISVKAQHMLDAVRAARAVPGGVCQAERSTTSNVQVNCLAEDGTSPHNTQSEVSLARWGDKVVVTYNDDTSAGSTGYSVSLDGGKSFTDMGFTPTVVPSLIPVGDPSVAVDDGGNFYLASLAFSLPPDMNFQKGVSEIVIYVMPAGSNQFQLLSIPASGPFVSFFADKEWLAIGPDGNGRRHFYLTWTHYPTLFGPGNQGPVTLSDSTDGIHWRTNPLTSPDLCQPLSPDSHPVPAGNKLYVSWEESDIAACTTNPASTTGRVVMATVNVESARVERVTQVARLHGSGDLLADCGVGIPIPVIETQPGHDLRVLDSPTSTIDAKGSLYLAWSDRPSGPGGGAANATRVYLSFSRDGNRTWSKPRVISGALAPGVMNDRFQPWLVADQGGLHAIWYERIANPAAGQPDLIRLDRFDMASGQEEGASEVNRRERPLSTVPFPLIQTNPPQDDAVGPCYQGDYNQVIADHGRVGASWGDNRNIVTISGGVTEHQPDIFFQAYRGGEGD